MSQKETVTVKFIILVGSTKPGCLEREYEFPVEAPAALCTPRTSKEPGPDADATSKFVSSVVEKHTPFILLSDPWRCIACDKPARDLLHYSVSALSPVTDYLPDKAQEPRIMDRAIPVCFGGGWCERAAGKLFEDLLRSSENGQTRTIRKGCDGCGKISGIKLCRACKQTGYCSPACQKKRWPVHKKRCKLAQNEQKEQALKEQKLKGQEELNGNPPEEPKENANKAKEKQKQIDIIVWDGKGNKKEPREATLDEQKEMEVVIKEREKREPGMENQPFQLVGYTGVNA